MQQQFEIIFFFKYLVVLKRTDWCVEEKRSGNLLSAGVLGDGPCAFRGGVLVNSPGGRRRTAVWISRLVMVDRLL